MLTNPNSAIYNNFSKTYLQSISTDFVVIEDTPKTEAKSDPQPQPGVVFAEETLMSDRELRDLLLNDVAESEAFIRRRLQELRGTEQATFNTYEDTSKPTILQANDNIEFLTAVIGHLQEACQALTSKRLFMLLNVKHNPS